MQDGVDVAVLVVGRVVGQALEEAPGVEGEQQMLVVDVVEGQHGAAGEQELRGDGQKTHVAPEGMRVAGSGPLANRGAVVRLSRRRASPRRNWSRARGFMAGTDMAECAYLYS